MSMGLGEYFSEGMGSVRAPDPDPTPLPRGPAAPPPAPAPQSGMGEYFAQNGLSAVNYGPIGGGRKPVRTLARKLSPAIGALGDAGDVISDTKAGVVTGAAAAVTLTTILVGLGLRFGAGWIVGKKLSPNAASERKYAWGGAIGSVFLGTLGLGIEALVADHARK